MSTAELVAPWAEPPVAGRLVVLAPLRIEASAARRGATSATVTRTGMGPARACAAIAATAPLLRDGQPVAIVGVCGALAPGPLPGDVLVAASVASDDGDITIGLAGADLVAAELRRAGLPVTVGPIVSTAALAKGPERARLARAGALAVDMETAWLAAAVGDRPLVVVRVVVDTPVHELWSLGTPGRVRLACRRLAATLPVLERWAATTRPRAVVLTAPRACCAGVASQDREEAVAALAAEVDVVLVVGAANSSDSRRLTEVAGRAGTPAHPVDGAADLWLAWLADVGTVGITAGASAPESDPESKVQEVVAALASLGRLTLAERVQHDERVSFPLPPEVR